MSKGVIYILTNPSFPQYVKIGYKCKWHNGIYGYLKEIGIVDIDIV